METIVLKFGGSSLADNEKLNIVASKIIEFYAQNKRVVVVVSAQGKTTDNLITQAKELSDIPNDREMDVLLSTGEQISIAKLSILLNHKGYESISLTGWQAGIYTSSTNQEAKIEKIDTSRILHELDKNRIVIIAGFQGINKEGDITTLGRGGSDTTAVAIASAIKADHCYIFSDVDGVYSADPNKITNTKKLDNISYEEMLDLSNEGAKVLHNRCIEIGQKYNVPIETGSTFNNNIGTVICDKIEESCIKSIVKKDISRISFIGYGIANNHEIIKQILEILDVNKIDVLSVQIDECKICIMTKETVDNKIVELLHSKLITG